MSLKEKNAEAQKSNRIEQRLSRKLKETKSRAKKRQLSSCDDSDSEDYDTGKKQGKCLSRNAIIARNNRIKKKNYITNLEKDVLQYKTECSNMKGTLAMQTKMIQTLRNEVQYLKNVLANSKEISLILKTVKDSTGLRTITSLKPNIKSEPADDDILLKKDIDLNSAALPMDDDDDYLMSNGAGNLTELFDDSGSSFSDLLNTAELTCNVGVCLHVAQQRVSLEFCSLCNSKAASAWESMAT